MARLVLVKHSMPAINPQTSAREWVLSDAGRDTSRLLAERLSTFRPDVIVTSDETKALETAEIVATEIKTPLEVWGDLHEHDRVGVPYLGDREFEQAMRSLFNNPSRVMFGNETADQARERFETSVLRAVAEHIGRSVVAVTHGTVITLFTAKMTGTEPFSLWKRLGLPSFVVFSLPGFELLEIVDHVA